MGRLESSHFLILSKSNPTVLAKVMEEAESVAAYFSNANSAAWGEGLVNEDCISTVQGGGNKEKQRT